MMNDILNPFVWKLMEILYLYILLDKRNSKTDMKVTVFKRKGSMDAGVRRQSKVFTGVRPQSKVASDCTLAPDPGAAGSTLVSDPGAANSNHVTGGAVDIRCIKH